jgi:hypothetical protein
VNAPHYIRPDHHELPRGHRTDGAGHDATSLNRRPRQSTAPAGLWAPAPEVVAEKAVKPKQPRPSRAKPPTERKQRSLPAHGTLSGYSRHKRLKEDVCEPCAEANRVHKREYNKRWNATKPKRVRKTYVRPDCGTQAGYDSHRAHKERACDACRAAHNEHQRDKRSTKAEREGREFKPRVSFAECGTASAYKRHRRNGEDACAACLEAKRVADAEYRAGRRAA